MGDKALKGAPVQNAAGLAIRMFWAGRDAARFGNPGQENLICSVWHVDTWTGGWAPPQVGTVGVEEGSCSSRTGQSHAHPPGC